MIPLFRDDATWTEALLALEAWIGTPYRHMTRVRGRGADCTLFIGAWLVEIGVLRDVRYDYYAKDWYDAAKTDVIVDAVYRHFREDCWPGFGIVEVPETRALERGDVLGFSTRRPEITNHVGVLVTQSSMIHCSEGRGVRAFEFGDCWRRRVSRVFRVVRTGVE